ncbi:MAG TPA: hypothetical protein VN031_00400 [Candidatus Microsaccharimonas sp.]|nr:hypothetical protein [Candidatus Microsaccharimonas sp.]
MNLHQNPELSQAISEPADISGYEHAMHLFALSGCLAISEGSFAVHSLGGSTFMSCAIEAGAVGFALLTEYARHERIKTYKAASADNQNR